ncbi:MAG: MoaD/ThiS family protein [archaeon]|nr:MoaD/ThiS family protein [archaeon]
MNETHSITINLAGNFSGIMFNEEKTLNFNNLPKIIDIFKKLNKIYKVKSFSAKAIKKNEIAILVNGERVSPKHVSVQKIDPSDIITIIQPISTG